MSMTTPIPTPDPKSVPWNDYINNQSFNVTGLDGTPVTLSFPEITSLQRSVIIDAIVRGFAVGFCSLLFILLLILTPSDRRKTAIFLLNMASLFLLTFDSILGCIIDAASYLQAGPQLLGAFAGYGPSTWAPSVMSSLIAPFLYASIMVSLVLQTRVVFAAEPSTRRIVTILGAVATAVEIGFVTTNSVYNIIAQYATDGVFVPVWIFRTLRLYFLIFVAICCVVFLYKLGMAVRRRSKMGINVRRFGPFQIIFITFSQCLIVPLVIYILDYTHGSSSIYITIAEVTLVCSLPLSSLWASADARDHEQRPLTVKVSNSSLEGSSQRRSKFSFLGHEKGSDSGASGSTDIEKAPSYTTAGAEEGTSH